MPILKKLNATTITVSAILLIREREETRGGEVAELIYFVMTKTSDKVCLFKKEGIALSQMIMEFLDAENVIMRTYQDKDDLLTAILRYLTYRIDGDNKSES